MALTHTIVGSIALAAEVVIGSLLPIFVLQYAGLDPRTIQDVKLPAGQGINLNPLDVLPFGAPDPDLSKIILIATVPFLGNGVASYFLVPLSIAMGRRPVLLVSALTACLGGLWAGLSADLDSHIVARAVSGLGAGAVDALLPLIVSDLVFIHERNKAMSTIFASRAVFITALGAAAPYIAANYDWRWIYFITSGLGLAAWILLIAFLPETRWKRSKAELCEFLLCLPKHYRHSDMLFVAGHSLYPLSPDESRPELDLVNFTPRTMWTNLGVFQFGFQWKDAYISILNTLRTTLFPNVIWCVLLNSIFSIVNASVQQIVPFVLVAQGWKFQYTGISVIPFVLASVLVYFFAGPIADRMANKVTRWKSRHGGSREPEHHLVNLIIPTVIGILGCFTFGYAGQDNLHWAVILLSSFFIIFAFLTVMSVLNVFIVESYPMWAGPVLINVSSLRLIISFFFSSQSMIWVQELGFLETFVIYGEAMIVLSLGIPLLYFWGKKLRQRTAGKVEGQLVEQRILEDGESAGEI